MAFEKIVQDKTLRSIREEERIVFESTQAINMDEAVRDVAQIFAFPPALNYPRARPGSRCTCFQNRINVCPTLVASRARFVDVETMYEYFVRVAFENGTTAEIPAGFMSFRRVRRQTNESTGGSLDPIANDTAGLLSTRDNFAFSQGTLFFFFFANAFFLAETAIHERRHWHTHLSLSAL